MKSKTFARSRAHTRFTRDDIYTSMEHLPDLATYMYKVECHGYANTCDLTFQFPKKLSFAFVGKLAAGFSSHCRKLAEAEDVNAPPAGQLSLTFDANKE